MSDTPTQAAAPSTTTAPAIPVHAISKPCWNCGGVGTLPTILHTHAGPIHGRRRCGVCVFTELRM